MTRQLSLPDIPGSQPRRRTQHRFGVFGWVDIHPDTAGDRRVWGQVCRSCGCIRHEANTGARLGAHRRWSLDGGKAWAEQSPACTTKDRC